MNQVVKWTRHYYFPIPKLPEFVLSRIPRRMPCSARLRLFWLSKVISQKNETDFDQIG